MSEGIDFSWARPGGAAIQAAGKTFVMRYLYPDGPGGKGLDLSEVQDYRAHGLAVGVVFESSGGRSLSGFAAGASDAQIAVGQLVSLGMAGTPVYFAVDFDATPAQYTAIASYLDGAASVLGKNKTGLYAGLGPIDALVGVHCAYGWQTYAWSGGRVSSKAHVYQYKNGQTLNGSSVDYCRSLKPDFGAYGTSLAEETGTPITPPRRHDDMSKLYYQQDTTPTLYALAGDSPGTPANWLETTDQGLANGWSAQIGAASIPLNAATFANYKADYLSPLAIGSSVSASVDLGPLLDAIKAIPKPPTGGTITLT